MPQILQLGAVVGSLFFVGWLLLRVGKDKVIVDRRYSVKRKDGTLVVTITDGALEESWFYKFATKDDKEQNPPFYKMPDMIKTVERGSHKWEELVAACNGQLRAEEYKKIYEDSVTPVHPKCRCNGGAEPCPIPPTQGVYK